MILTNRSKAANYSAGLVYTISGNDSNPSNLLSVAANRRIAIPRGFFLTSATAIASFALDGTNMVVRHWFYDLGTDAWIPNGAASGALVGTGANSLVQVVGYMPGALFFAQVVSNAGSATKLATLIR